jgi:hypothetical protein
MPSTALQAATVAAALTNDPTRDARFMSEAPAEDDAAR